MRLNMNSNKDINTIDQVLKDVESSKIRFSRTTAGTFIDREATNFGVGFTNEHAPIREQPMEWSEGYESPKGND